MTLSSYPTGQGFGNVASAVIGGMPGAGTMGATLVNLSSGGQSRLSGVFAGGFALLALLIFSRVIAWVPYAALAGILIVVGFKMIDVQSFLLLKQKSTLLDFTVILAVILTALFINLIAASGVGIALSILLFLREQIRSSLIRRKLFGNQVSSKKRRIPEEMTVLEEHGGKTVVFQLQGSLFFGTADQLYSEVEAFLKSCQYIILDLKRVRSVDFTAIHRLELMADQLADSKGYLILTNVESGVGGGNNLLDYFKDVGFLSHRSNIKIKGTLYEALEWVEDQILKKFMPNIKKDGQALTLKEIELFSGLSEENIAIINAITETRSLMGQEKVFTQGDHGDEIFLIRQGSIRILLPVKGSHSHHLASFGKGGFFGDMAFLDGAPRSADAVAEEESELYVLSRSKFDNLTEVHPEIGKTLFHRLALGLSKRLRHTDAELSALGEN